MASCLRQETVHPSKAWPDLCPLPACGGMQMAPEELALVHSLRKMVRNDWVSVRATCCLSVSGFGDRKFFI